MDCQAVDGRQHVVVHDHAVCHVVGAIHQVEVDLEWNIRQVNIHHHAAHV